jgi:hypothetical protein
LALTEPLTPATGVGLGEVGPGELLSSSPQPVMVIVTPASKASADSRVKSRRVTA